MNDAMRESVLRREAVFQKMASDGCDLSKDDLRGMIDWVDTAIEEIEAPVDRLAEIVAGDLPRLARAVPKSGTEALGDAKLLSMAMRLVMARQAAGGMKELLNSQRMQAELAPLPLRQWGVWSLDTPRPTAKTTSCHVRKDRLIVLEWVDVPNKAQLDLAQKIIDAHDGRPTLQEKLDGLDLPGRVLAAHNEILWAKQNGEPEPPWALELIQQTHEKVLKARNQ